MYAYIYNFDIQYQYCGKTRFLVIHSGFVESFFGSGIDGICIVFVVIDDLV